MRPRLKQKLFNNARKIPAHRYILQRGFSHAKGWRIKREGKSAERERKRGRKREGEKANAREKGRRKTGAFYFEFRRPLNKFALAGTVNRQKIYWSSRALIGDVYHAAIFSSWNTARAPLFCQSLTPLFLPARPRLFDVPHPTLPLALPLSSLFFYFYFFFFFTKKFFLNFSLTASEPSRFCRRRNCRDRSTVSWRSAPSHECFRAKSS